MRVRLGVLLILYTLLAHTLFAQNQAPVELVFISEPQVTDQRISVDLVVRGANGITTADLTTPNFAVSEDSRDLNVTSEARLPIVLDVIVDLSFGSDVDLIQDTLRAYFNTYYREDDTIRFYILGTQESRRQAEVVTPSGRQAILDLIDSFQMSDRFYTITETVEASREHMREVGDSPDTPRAVLFVGSLLNDLSEADTTRIFAREGIPFHIVQAHRERQPSTQFYREMAANGGGLFSNNVDGGFVFREAGQETAINTLKILYDTIANSRLVYTLSYTTRSASLDNVREVTVTAQISDENAVSNTFSYSTEFEPPRVILVNDAVLNTVRRTYRDADLNVTFDNPEQAVDVRVEFPDGVSRQIQSLELRILDAGSGDVLQTSQLDINPEPRASGEVYTLIWPLVGYSVPNTVSDIRLEVEVVDELGLSNTLVRNGTVRVETAPPLPTATPLPPTPTAIPVTEAPTLAPTEIPADTTTAEDGTATSPVNALTAETITQSPVLQVFLAVIVILSLIVIYLIFMMRRYRRSGTLVRMNGATGEDEYTTDAGQNNNGNNANGAKRGKPKKGAPVSDTEEEEELPLLGRLVVKLGLPDREVLIYKHEFVIGRSDGEDVDYRVDQPFVGMRHCRLMIDEEGVFSVRDLGTKNGTFVNGERIDADHDVLVPVGSEVGITKNIIVEFWDPDTEITFDEEIDPLTGLSTRHTTGTAERELSFPALPGMRYAADDSEDIPEDYSPI